MKIDLIAGERVKGDLKKTRGTSYEANQRTYLGNLRELSGEGSEEKYELKMTVMPPKGPKKKKRGTSGNFKKKGG